jgi:DNA-binding SARP family transcriptional activator/tetratricopeptide (TPR) repeat protein
MPGVLMDAGRSAEFRVLGPLEVDAGGRVLEIGGPRLRVLLALLLARAGRVLSVPALVDGLWGRHAPPEAERTVRVYVSRLREALLPAAAGAEGLIVTQAPGYLLRLDPDAIDAARFERLVLEGRQALEAERPAVASQRLTAALALWRGDAYAEFLSIPVLSAEAARLEQVRLGAVADRVELGLAAGMGGELVAELDGLTRKHPGNERLWGQLMRALYRTGRQSDALATFRRAREVLAEESGVDPSPQLAEIHRQILVQDDRLLAPVAAPGARLPRPAQLPSAVRAFTGRDRELAHLDAVLSEINGSSRSGPATVVISAVSGTAGVGKTALAVWWAHRVADRFPDGQLYVNLRGYDLDQPMTAADALAGFLVGLGVPGQDLPLGVEDRASRYRSEIAGRRMLVLLDNAATVEQVRPLLPGTPTAAVVVTSRDSLAGLVALHGARRLELDLLPAADARGLLRELVGDRVDADPEAAARLAGHCARLPLALRVAAELASAHPDRPLSAMVAELDDQRRRLEMLDSGGDPRAAVTAVFSWSYRHLPPAAARLFRLAALHPAGEVDVYAAAALIDADLEQARGLLAVLARAHLVHTAGAGRHGMHDLLHAYAAGLASTEDGEAGRRAALGRLLDYYLSVAATAMDRLHPAEAHRRPRVPPPLTPAPDVADPASARAWLDAERPTLVAVAGHAATHGWPAHATWLAATLFRYLVGGHYADALTLNGHAYQAARLSGDLAGEAQALHDLGTVHLRLGRHLEAAERLQQALVLFREAGDRIGQARALGNLGTAEQRLGRYREAAGHYEQALAHYRQAGDRVGEASVLDNLGSVEERLGRYQPAADQHRHALILFRLAGDLTGQAQALTNLGDVETRMARYEEAADHHQQALALYRQAGDRTGEAWALTGLGDLDTRRGRPGQAARQHRQALALFREIGDRDAEPWALNGLGEAATAAGRAGEALTHHSAAHAAATATGARDQQARAQAGLAAARHALAEPDRARHHLRQALALYTELGAPETEQIRARLTALDAGA